MKLFLGVCLLILVACTPHLITSEPRPPIPRMKPQIVPQIASPIASPTISLLPTITPDTRENK